VGIIYYVMRVKIELWRKALGRDGNVRGAGRVVRKIMEERKRS
jgi:hypothetical protein